MPLRGGQVSLRALGGVGAIPRRSHSCHSALLLSSGILQLVNASYGIKPLEVAPGYQHLVYPMWNENIETRLFIENSSLAWTVEVSLEPEDAIAVSTPPGCVVFGGMVAIDLGNL